MILLIGMLLVVVAASVFVSGSLQIFLDRARTLRTMQGETGRTWGGLVNLWAVNRKSPQTIFMLIGLFAGLIGLLLGHSFLTFAVGIAIGYLVPRILYSRRNRMRLRKLDEQFAPALVLVANGMRAGQTLVQSLDLAAGSLKDPIAGEFLAISRQIRLGMPTEDALVSFSRRVPLPESVILVKAMQISLLTGANLPAALGQVATTIASRAKLERRVKTLTAQGKAQGLIIGIAPIVLGIGFSILNPVYFRTMVGTFLGNCIIVTVLVLQTIGFLLVQRITKVPF
jgi:tight adherence protein B